MTKTKWVLLALGIMDLILIIMHGTGYYFLFLKPTGYVIPMVINLVVLTIIGFRAKLQSFLFVQAFLKYGQLPGFFFLYLSCSFMVLLMGYSYTKINSPYDQQPLAVEYRHFTLGETTYFYNFYETKFGLIGKQLEDQTISIVDRERDFDPEGALGLGNEEWLTENSIRFYTWNGPEDVYLDSSQPLVETEDTENLEEAIKQFMDKAKKKEDGETITINGNELTIRYDEAVDQEWIDVANDNEQGASPSQQCSRIIPDEERGYYMLEECAHQWEYLLYPMDEKR